MFHCVVAPIKAFSVCFTHFMYLCIIKFQLKPTLLCSVVQGVGEV